MALDPSLIRDVFERAMAEFLGREVDEILDGVNERANCGRLAIYLQNASDSAGFAGYLADTEYNRKQEGKIKTILDDQHKVIAINCDLILHSRGKSVEEDNLVAIEVKKSSRPEPEKAKDRDRLRALTKSGNDEIWSADGIALPEHVCGYVWGIFIELNRRKRIWSLEYYVRGELKEQREVSF